MTGDVVVDTFLADVGEVLHNTHNLAAVDVALRLAACGVLVVPTVPGDKDPMLSTKHTADCRACTAAGMRSMKDHGETTDPDVIRRYWSIHPDAGVGMKDHPRLVRGDGDFADAAELKKVRKQIGYGQTFGEPLPCEARTPGGHYRQRFIHELPDGVTPPGGGTRVLGVSWYGSSGYVVVKGEHPNGGSYGPFYGEITPLPEKVALALAHRQATDDGPVSDVSDSDFTAFLDAHVGTAHLDRLAARRRDVASAPEGGRHHAAVANLTIAFRDAIAGYYPARVAKDAIREALGEAGWEQARFTSEWPDICRWAVKHVAHLTPETAQAAIDERRDERLVKALSSIEQEWQEDEGAHRDISDFAELEAIEAKSSNAATTKPEATDAANVVGRDGATFILDEPADLEARWGGGSDVLWAHGESLMVVGPPGVGKTTVAGQITGGLIGVLPTFLGYPIRPARRVLYLAMDRPRQVRRALARLFHEQHRDALRDRLVVRPGPLPTDLAKNPTQLVELARHYDCDVIVIDSLKDAAVKLTDDETGGNVNRAIQLCNVADLDVLVLHHQRKGQGGDKPTTLTDVYGSTWLTAGTGSVILLWGEAGSELVELTHLKQPADPVGPLNLEHDHHAGTTRITHGFDALAFLRSRPEGVTVSDAAQAEHASPQKPGSAKWKKTERRLRSLVRDGLARADNQGRLAGQFGEARYHAEGVPKGQTDG